MGRIVFIETEIKPPPVDGRGRKTSWAGSLAKQMNVNESYFTRSKKEADQLRESIRHYYGKGAATVAKKTCREERFTGWRIWRKK